MNLSVGNTIQIGLMSAVGYFDSCEHCGVTFGPRREPTPDWLVERLMPSDDRYYPFHVEGTNLNCSPDEYGYRFSWSVMALNWRYAFQVAA